MPKVIKSSQLFIGKGKEIGWNCQNSVALVKETITFETEKMTSFDSAQAQQIIVETEVMVTELLEKARLQAKEILDEARIEAEQLRRKTEQEAQQALRMAKEEGYNQGKEQLFKDMAAEREASQIAAQRIIATSMKEREKMLAKMEPDLVRLAIEVAKKVINTEIKQSPEIVANIVRAALKRANGSTEIKIKVNPSQKDVLEAKKGSLESERGEYRLIEIEADPAIEPGGCIVDSGAGYVDGQINQQLKSLEGALLRVVGG